jgi:predicted dehydrogenase
MHCASYVSHLSNHGEAQIAGVWDDDSDRGKTFCEKRGLEFFDDLETLLDRVDAVVVTSENHGHLALVEAAAKHGKHVICEKPVVARSEDVPQMRAAVEGAGIIFMTAFPCRFSPAFDRLKSRIASGEIGKVLAINATNRGTCPFSWFVQPALSGGGAMIDHVVHVTDLLRDLLGEEVQTVQAQIGNNVYGQEWEDTAMLTLDFPSGIFATLDSSWSRPKNFKTWGDVTLTVVGETGVIEMDMFGPGLDVYKVSAGAFTSSAYGSNLDGAMIDEFLRAVSTGTQPRVTLKDGLEAAKVALAGYRSVAEGSPVAVG